MIAQLTTALVQALQFQIGRSWRLDFISLFIGIVIGLLITFAALRRRRYLSQARPVGSPPSTSGSSSRPPAADRWQRSALEKKYHAAVAELVQSWHFAAHLAPLERLFVAPPILGPLPLPHPARPAPLAATQLAPLWPELAARIALPPLPAVSVRSLLLNGRRVVLSSPEGSGKSTLLAYCAYLCATADSSASYAFLQRHIPVFVHVAALRLAPDDDSEDMFAPLLRALHATGRGLAPLLQEKAEAGQILLLLDGWSEVPSEIRSYTISWLRRFLAAYGAVSVFVASNQQGFEPLLNLEFTLSGLLPWRASHALRLGERWAAALQTFQPPPLEHYWQPHQSILETTVRLWATFAGVQLPEHHLPALLQTALEHFAIKAAGDELSPDDVSRFWRALAHASSQQHDVALGPTQIEALARTTLQRHELPAPEVERHVGALRLTLQRAPFLSGNAANAFRWTSPQWRDHLAASYICHDTQPHNLRKILRDPARNNLLLHLAYLDSVDELAKWILDRGSRGPQNDDLFQVASWLAVSHADESWRQQALIQLGQLISRPEAPDIQRLRAIAALPDCKEPGILPLLRQLRHRSDPAIRQLAAAALARFDATESVPLLREMLQDHNADVRLSAVHALGWMQRESALEQLLLILIARDDLMRFAVANVLALGGGEEWRALRDAAIDEDLRVRRAAARGLSAIEEGWAAELLRQMAASDAEWLVRSAADQALQRREQQQRQRPWYPAPAANLDWVVQWSTKHGQAAPGGAAAVTLLCEMVSTAPERAIRHAAARALAQVAIPAEERNAVWATLWQAARSESNGVVREAAHVSLAFLRRVRGP